MQDKSGIFHEIESYLQDWHCTDSTILKCYQRLSNDLIENGLIIEESRQITGKNEKFIFLTIKPNFLSLHLVFQRFHDICF